MNRLLCNCRDLALRLWRQFNFKNSEFSDLQLAFNYSHSPVEKHVGPSMNFPSVLDSILGDGFLWAVPKNRRTVERRASRRMGYGKMLIPKKNLLICDACGHFHLAHAVCGNCYEKVKKETEIMQEAIKAEIKLNPIKKDVVVLYEDDARDDETVNGKMIVELPKKRPPWFSRNLLSVDSGTRKPTTTIGDHIKQPAFKDD